MACLYTVYKTKSKHNDQRVGDLHYSDNAETTLCGLDITSDWYIIDNTFSATATCKACIKIDEETILPQRTKGATNQ